MSDFPPDEQAPPGCPGCGLAMMPGKLELGQTAFWQGFDGMSMGHLFFTPAGSKPAPKESVFSWAEKRPRKGWRCATCGMVLICSARASEPPPPPPRNKWWEKYR